MEVNQRIKQLRQSLELSQAKFAQSISISNGYIAGIELGSRKVNERIVKLICSAFNASEQWLKNGEGEMFKEASNRKLDRAISLFKELNPDFQDYVLQQIDKLLELQSTIKNQQNTLLKNSQK